MRGAKLKETHSNDIADEGRHKHIIEFDVFVLQYVLKKKQDKKHLIVSLRTQSCGY